MRFHPYESIGKISLEINESELIKIFGEPKRIATNSIGLKELDFGSEVFRFEPKGELAEVSVESEILELDAFVVPFTQLTEFLTLRDEGVFDKVGFIISPKFGLAFDPEFPPWVTVLSRIGIANWQKI